MANLLVNDENIRGPRLGVSGNYDVGKQGVGNENNSSIHRKLRLHFIFIHIFFIKPKIDMLLRNKFCVQREDN